MKLPFISTPDVPLTTASQDFVPIADITEDLVVYKDGGATVVMESTSLNFSLLSEKEQQAVIYAYAALLNSLSFSVQILVRSQRKDITNYLNYLDAARTKIANPKLLSTMDEYRHFITESVKKKNVLGKKFYVIIPFSYLELGVGKSIAASVRRGKVLPYPKSYIVQKAKVALYPRRDHLMRQANRLGIKLRQLGTEELATLFYKVYNQEGGPS